MRDLENYFFMDEDWDRPLILDSNDNVIMDLSVCDNMYSFVLINNKFYFAKDQSHDGAICNALFEIHNLKSIEQIERKFKDRIDNICYDIRKRIPLEGRYWGKANIIQFTDRHSNCNLTSDEAVQYICNSLNLNINNVNILQYIPELEMSIIKRYKQGIKMLYESKIKDNIKVNENMKKQTIKLNEGQLQKVIKESVKKVLMESYVWYGDVTPLETIMTACYEIRNRMQDRDFDGYEDQASYDLLEWANRVYEQAEKFIRHNSDNVSIN